MGALTPSSAVPPAWLDQLAPAHAVAPPGIWPLAPGWWLLIGLPFLAAALIYAWRRYRRSLRHLALNELRRIDSGAAHDTALARDLENLLRRFAVARYGRGPVARLNGDEWIAFVAARGGSALAGDSGRELLRAAYGTRARADRAQWLRGARGFIRNRAFGKHT
ncbi:MAG: hypothetical protein JWQ90_4669 [Hydrocarboniphaga sp.]|uniref:DUF4381 domain-containing protein n=1 Tax=Hydrocarboniphaga sp. TaxID=2033016 RepID=UPI00261D28A2|nr:DUF4381 domain-containing protein [Hydrocarboniphaga sp.]MDB5972219.1 hypothetical protein [Hydrocarboniphaga sp.]